MIARTAAAAVLGAGLSLTVISPAQAMPGPPGGYSGPVGQNGVQTSIPVKTGPGGSLVLASQPSEHCGYYHWIVNGTNIGDGYECTKTASLNTYHAWVKCQDGSTNRSRTEPKGEPAYVACDNGTSNPNGVSLNQGYPVTGGFTRDS